jgi:hypothetical protein
LVVEAAIEAAGSELEGVGSDGLHRERWLPWAEQWVGDLRDVHGGAGHLEHLQDAAQRLQPPGQLAVAGAQHGVLAIHLAELAVERRDARLHLRVLGLEAGNLGDQLLQPLLLPRAGAARGLPVGQHPLALALVGGESAAAAAVGVALRARAPARRHCRMIVPLLGQIQLKKGTFFGRKGGEPKIQETKRNQTT